MSDAIIWEEPPATASYAGQKPGAYKEFADALRTAPHKWAILPGERKTSDSAKGTAQNVRRGVVKGFTKGEFETAVDGTKIYVRFIGTVDQDQVGELADGDEGDVEDAPDGKKVRAWANANGFTLPERGRMPQDVHDAYRSAHAYQQPPAGEPVDSDL